jgi:hypothetical protein
VPWRVGFSPASRAFSRAPGLAFTLIGGRQLSHVVQHGSRSGAGKVV